MRLRYLALLFPLSVSPLLSQTQIGGGTCNSSSLSGAYTFTLSGRQVATSGAFTGVFQANGTATFDGTSKVTMAMNAANAQTSGTTLSYSGTYAVQSNCGGTVTISAGDSATFNLIIYNQGKSFLLTGSDATYDYSGGGSNQPATCGAGLLSGAYVFSSNGYTLASGSVQSVRNASGLIQMDGKGGITATFMSLAPQQSPISLTISGTYVLPNGCTGTGSLTDSLGDTFTLGFTVSASTATSTTSFDVVVAQPGKLLFTGSAHAVYGQPTATGGEE